MKNGNGNDEQDVKQRKHLSTRGLDTRRDSKRDTERDTGKDTLWVIGKTLEARRR